MSIISSLNIKLERYAFLSRSTQESGLSCEKEEERTNKPKSSNLDPGELKAMYRKFCTFYLIPYLTPIFYSH